MPRCRLASLLLAAFLAAPAVAHAQVAPRMMIAVDTSGSMALDMNGVPTFGDGVLDNCAARAGGEYCGTNCTAGIDTDCDGDPDDSRIYIAREAIRNMVLSTGDVDWALSRFRQRQGLNTSCLIIDNYECNSAGPYVTSYGNPQCNSDRNIPNFIDCPFDWPSLWPAACRPGSGGEPPLQTWRSGDPVVCTNYSGTSPSGMCLAGGDILVGFPDSGEYAGRTNAFGILKWIDNTETNFLNDTTEADFCDHSNAGDCELRPEGPTPLAALIDNSRDYMVPIRMSDSAAACRPYSILLITDGVESCGGDPVSTAGNVLTADDIRTYVVGMSIASSADRDNLNDIAAAGGTSSAYFADNPDTLAAALSDIVADSLLVETCNNMDDDCDMVVDEGFTKYCDRPSGTTTETLCDDPGESVCDGVDDNCNGEIDEGLTNACGTCGAVPTEVCDGIDNDCDGIIDEGDVCSGCTPSAEICDNLDNDCDGTIDESLSRPCGTDVGECTSGTQTCSAGAWGTCTGTGPTTEVCDGLDNDCDGTTDGMSRSCGIDTGACEPGSELCTSGSWGSCTGEVGPSAEICDGVDNDCDGTVDDGNPGGGGSCGSSIGNCEPGTVTCSGGFLVCTGGVSPEPETCDGTDEDCDGTVDDGVPTAGACGSSVGECSEGALTCVGGSFTCVGGRGSTTEVCDGLDNDCDASTDEGNPGGGVACGTDVGECTPGTSACSGGTLVCSGGTPPGVETCDGTDEDCDGLIDEGNPGGGGTCGATDVGECEYGAMACVGGALVCRGETGPGTEICDGLDNDCDGSVDEGNPEGGGACGDDTGECTPGTRLCTGGTLVCDGGTGPSTEVCNGLDDDCDGVVDDGLGVGAPCGMDTGECAPGVNVCRSGALVCEGEVGPIEELCDLLDNDCDGSIDEGLSLGDACGSDLGICLPGTEQCVDGRVICVGAVPPAREACDCDDNDCDGTVDEAPDSGTLCPEGSACVDCACALPCMESEFGFTCPSGRTPKVVGPEECWCVRPACDAEACAMETMTGTADEVLCAPDSEDVSACVCKNNECTFPCDGVVCSDGLVCNPRDPAGRCVPDSCAALGCPSGELCNVATGECEADACDGVTCGAGQACRGGACEPSCATVECPAGEHCASGACVADPCAGVDCNAREWCNPDTGTCEADPCDGVRCPVGAVCDSATGECAEDPCRRLRCPEDEICVEGECALPGSGGTDAGPGGFDAGVDAGDEPAAEGTRVLATGGGGCVCSVPGHDDEAPTPGALAALLALVGLLSWRRLGRRGPRRSVTRFLPVLLVIAAVLLFGNGCEVDPYCIDCEETADGGPVDTGVDTGRPDTGPLDAGVPDTGPADAGPDGCVPGAPELCNELDEDCDGNIDEGIDTDVDVNNCGGCGMACSPPHAFGECVGGTCGLGTCDVGWWDLNGELDDGCEYRCLITEDDDALCDLRDNDCDGAVDEDVAFDTDPVNCGSCGRVCRFAHAAGSCSAGDCVLGTCDAGFHDADGVESNGCEYACTVSASGAEECNGRDDDCDGSIDEGDPGGGATCGSDVGACSTGTDRCVGGTIVCDGEVAPTTELCNGVDDDCDGTVDQGDPEGGALCGTGTGTCDQGRQQCVSGSLSCVGAVGPATELCDGLDNDCDGAIDDGNPEGGGSCGDGTGACVEGTSNCRGGVLVCEGAVGPATETCNGIDDDCDGSIDEGNPGGGGSCGTDAGECAPGTWQCSGGMLGCVGGTGPSSESCNALDDDCDGSIDEGNPGGGAACGMTTGECSAGAEQCLGGTIQCVGATGPTLETCNTADDDCDASTDEGYDLDNDLRNCGSCGNVCSFANASATCSSGTCAMGSCDAGWFDQNGSTSDGCEYMCDFAGSEICNGQDDDCDGSTDEGLTPPTSFCNPNGVCASTSATCGGTSGWTCPYPSTYESTETTCDGLDNDCDGTADDPYPLVGSSCNNGGTGLCRTSGSYVCNSAGDGVECNAPTGPAPTTEACDNLDNDCDGTVDEEIPVSAQQTVTIPRSGGGSVTMFRYEASRADATSLDAGQASTVACSTGNRRPWTNVTWPEANAACCALNASGACTGDGSGWRLCDAADWQTGCEAGSSCTWSYSTSCNSSNPLRCNGEEFDCGSASGDQDCVFPTGSSTFSACYADWGAAGRINDMSGNVKEWTYDERSAGIHEIRGGAYNNVEGGRTCQFDFTLGDETFAFPHTGFRCCYY